MQNHAFKKKKKCYPFFIYIGENISINSTVHFALTVIVLIFSNATNNKENKRPVDELGISILT